MRKLPQRFALLLIVDNIHHSAILLGHHLLGQPGTINRKGRKIFIYSASDIMLSSHKLVTNSIALVSLVLLHIMASTQFANAGLTFYYSGTVTSIENEGGSDLWAEAVIGSTISGSFSYDLSASPDSGGERYNRWIFPSVPGGEQQFNIAGPTFQANAPSMDFAVYRVEFDTLTYGGTVIQYQDWQVELFPVPAGKRLVTNGFALDFLSRNAEYSTFPNLPISFMPLDRWNFENPAGASGVVWAHYYDSNDRVEGTMLRFVLDQVVAVPEPSSFFLVGIAVFCQVLTCKLRHR